MVTTQTCVLGPFSNMNDSLRNETPPPRHKAFPSSMLSAMFDVSLATVFAFYVMPLAYLLQLSNKLMGHSQENLQSPFHLPPPKVTEIRHTH